MDYKKEIVEKIKDEIDSNELIKKCRLNEKDFTRNRKVTSKDLILYEFNKRGLSTKMEIINFNNINDVQEISSPGLFKQREKLNPKVFVYLQQIALKNFYIDHENEVKTYKGYVLKAVDGSDYEIPNKKSKRTI